MKTLKYSLALLCCMGIMRMACGVGEEIESKRAGEITGLIHNIQDAVLYLDTKLNSEDYNAISKKIAEIFPESSDYRNYVQHGLKVIKDYLEELAKSDEFKKAPEKIAISREGVRQFFDAVKSMESGIVEPSILSMYELGMLIDPQNPKGLSEIKWMFNNVFLSIQNLLSSFLPQWHHWYEKDYLSRPRV